ncbi:acyltransferase domain-containing protein [Saccharothrix algeriensis]|uniref:[acyl-carrier-protein] S-malonyltransferase n=1 Tax=Saccharothrix algeriensis TaxID=173560 RepID=A0A0R5ZYA6_9PSEU|nr:acyltransferase domain-containing protein [Saccharothrix algeriensis]AJI44189.1 hypothetical protein [Saccharothrix algeriensis]MBM7815139.1 acyl transferase domain-containing protein/acyl carrier protein [Saccharothrix algeriensis]QTR03388.1 acyltransferase domain-containing protein [Saccharothrix algeriensis]
MSDRPVLLFPGLGACSAGVLRQARQHHAEVDETFAEIDRAAARLGVPAVSPVLFAGAPVSVRDLLAGPAEVAQLAVFGVSVAVHRILAARGVRPRLLVGHSFGEMAALVAAGAFTLADGVRLVCARAAALEPWEGRGGMAAIGLDEETAGHLVGVLGDTDLVVACLNAPRQTVLAGSPPELDRAERLAAALGVQFARLHLPYASHHPSMRAAVGDFMARMANVRQQPLQQPVYSPIHRRHYTDDDDLRLALAECLVLPVRFTDTVRWLHARGCTTFIESGALNALTKCVQQTVPGVRVFAPLLDPAREDAGLRAAAESGGRADPLPDPLSHNGNGQVGTPPTVPAAPWPVPVEPPAPLSSVAPAPQAALPTPSAPSPATSSPATPSFAALTPSAPPPSALTPAESMPAEPSPFAPSPTGLPAVAVESQVVGVVAEPPAAPSALAGWDRPRVVAELRELYARALEYPADLLTEDALLEAELGVDSLKQTSLLTKVAARFGLPDRVADLPVWELPTLGRIADYVTGAGTAR